MTQIKICGLTRIEEAAYIAKNKISYAGIVLFYPKSKRNNTIENACRLIKELKRSSVQTKVVAVVVSPVQEQITQIEQAGFDLIQIHGQLSEELLENIKLPVFRAFNIAEEVKIEHVLDKAAITGIVFDGKVPGAGQTFDWNLVKSMNRMGKKLMLAGGLTVENVAQAIHEVHPDIVDVSSGVEYSAECLDSVENKDSLKCIDKVVQGEMQKKGKDPEKIKAFADAVRECLG